MRACTRKTRIIRVVSPFSSGIRITDIHILPPSTKECPCEPTDWRSQVISLTALEEVEIDGFKGDDHEHDLLKLILSCTPMLKIVTLKLSRELSSSNDGCAKIYDIVKAYPSVEGHLYLSSGKYFFCRHDYHNSRIFLDAARKKKLSVISMLCDISWVVAVCC
jgi:hypothetical protein